MFACDTRYCDEKPEKPEAPVAPAPTPEWREQEEQFKNFFYRVSGEVKHIIYEILSLANYVSRKQIDHVLFCLIQNDVLYFALCFIHNCLFLTTVTTHRS